MPIITLLEHLKNTQKIHTILAGEVTLNKIYIKDYWIDNSKTLLIFTNQGHEIQLSVRDFKEVQFDAIISKARNSIEMFQCFTKLVNCGKYNAYFIDKDDNFFLNFYRIPSDY